MLFLLFVGLGFLGMRMSYLPHLEVATLCLLLVMGILSLSCGVVFQLVGSRFPQEIGAVTGLVAAAGGIGALLIPAALVYSRDWSGRFGPGFVVLGMSGFVAAGLVIQGSRNWDERPIVETHRPRATHAVIASSHAPARTDMGVEVVSVFE